MLFITGIDSAKSFYCELVKVKIKKKVSFNSLKVLSVKDWKFWIENGYIVIKNAVAKEQAKKTASFFVNLRKKRK